MGAVADALAALKEVLQMRGDIDRLAKNVDKLATLADGLDRRMIRIETMVEIASRRASSSVTRLPKK
jgi:t-SNARE complex subunit (syntaxin)